MSLRRIVESDRTLRAIGFDDAPFERGQSDPVGLAGVVSKGTRFDGMVWGTVDADGDDANETIVDLLDGGKFLPQLHILLLDGVAFGGFNVVDLPALAERLDLPCATIMRSKPDFDAIERALQTVDRSERRLATIRQAGDLHRADEVFFQVAGTDPDLAASAIVRLTRTGHIPEPLRLAHLVASAVESGESGRRA